MLDVDINDKKEQRKFGLSTGAVLGVLGLLRFALHHFAQVPYIFWGLAVAFALAGLVAPGLLQPVLRVAVPLANVMNWIMTRVMLTLAFYLIITPSALLYRLISGDPLHRRWQPDATTYWEDPDPMPKSLDEYKNQF